MTRFSNETYFALVGFVTFKWCDTTLHLSSALFLSSVSIFSELLCWLFNVRKICLRICWTVTVCLMFNACFFILLLSIEYVVFQRTRFRNTLAVFFSQSRRIEAVLNFNSDVICTFVQESFYNEIKFCWLRQITR